MVKTIAWMLFLTVLMASCSRNKKAEDVSQSTPQIELSDASEFTENDPLADASLEAPEQALPLEDESAAPVITDVENEAAASITLGDGEGEYIVQKNETLMMIAFKLYGDYSKWRDLASRNAGAMKNGVVMAGKKLKYALPSQTFEWNPQGNPYLIRTGDTLGGISGSVYGTAKKWKSIWNNN